MQMYTEQLLTVPEVPVVPSPHALQTQSSAGTTSEDKHPN